MASWKYVLCLFGHGRVKGSGAGQQGIAFELKRCCCWMQVLRLHSCLVKHATGMGLPRLYNQEPSCYA